MSKNVDIPALGESVSEAILVKWLKEDGSQVALDEPVCELETDKANVELPAPAAGVLHHKRKQGETVRIGDTIAAIDPGGTATAKAAPTPSAPAPAAPTPAAPVAAAPKASAPKADSENLSPSVRRAVKETGVDPSTLHGSGPRGRIVKEDVMAAASDKGTAPKAAPSAPTSSGGSTSLTSNLASDAQGVRRVEMTKIRKRIAERLVSAQHTAAMLTTFNEIDMSAVMELREKYKARFSEIHGVNLGFMSFFARAAAQALGEFPSLNAAIEGNDILYHDYVHLGVAVSTERGLVVPTLRNVGGMGFAKIESEIKRMAIAARDGKLGLQELGGGTFTITNGGVFGSMMSTPIINPPQSGILGLHAIIKRPIGVGDKIELRPMMYVALSYDHRLVDGKDSVSFLVRVKNLIEDPTRLMLEV